MGLLACTERDPKSCEDNYCEDPALPFCDVDGRFDGEPNRCIAVECTPQEFAGCRDDQALVCNPEGNSYDESFCQLGCDETAGCVIESVECEPGKARCGAGTLERCSDAGVFVSESCAAGCVEAPEAHCAYLEPQYLPDICDEPATAGHLDFGPFDTNIDSQCNGGIVQQDGGPEICVLRYSTITLPTGIEARVTGQRALALVADGRLDVKGVLDIGASATATGPGGGLSDLQNPSSNNSIGGPAGAGGPGGGFATPGGAGAAANGAPVAGTSAIAFLSQPNLIGGTGNLAGPSTNVDSGGAGGAATLVSCHGTVSVTGTIDAGGGGGGAGMSVLLPPITVYYGGYGGGSGGFVALQGLGVSVRGALYANGGSGGNGWGPDAAGTDGRRSISCAVTPAPATGGRGGAGGCANSAPSSGTAPSSGVTGGGGGGSAGGFAIYLPDGVSAELAPTEVSPAISPLQRAGVR